MPYVEFEDEKELADRMAAVQELLAKNLAERMIANNSIDMDLSVKAKPGEESYYEFTAKAVITNPNMVVSEDIRTFNRIIDYAEHTEFKSEEERDNFYDVLERMRPNPISLQ